MFDERRLRAALCNGPGVRYLVGLPIAPLLETLKRMFDNGLFHNCAGYLMMPCISIANTSEEYHCKTAFLEYLKAKNPKCLCINCANAMEVEEVKLQMYPRSPPPTRNRIRNIYDRKINIQIKSGALIYYMNASQEVIARSYNPNKKKEYEKNYIAIPTLFLQNCDLAHTIL